MPGNEVFILDDSYKLTDKVVSIHDIIGANNAMYMNLILLSSSVILAYVIWTNFFINSKYQSWLESKSIDIHELAIFPTVVLVITTLSYKGVI